MAQIYPCGQHISVTSATCQASLPFTVALCPLLDELGIDFFFFLLLRLSASSPQSLFIFSRKYNAITALEQRQQYKEDFCAEYDEYRVLHDRIGAITEMFVQLGSKINTLSPGTQEYKVLPWRLSPLCLHPAAAQIRNVPLKTRLILLISCSSWRTKSYKSIENIKR